ncbi:fimbrial protein [Cronobacter turicensis]|jgi:major type 1 subunit fimbrin (pilin)|uniref:fimbrial protein n=1 Tax=Cronobacter turicensis TaxID=413502 RepID=UPI00031E64B4|nr:fimbrial protein [Cronobacter turicensis]EKM0374816.1 fimbrial protein [Cronobacter turicensis]EKM5063071.1 fimbrial protein [Cronobacter turicensis]EKY3193136.1 fimbrial protein [Cronobacter turicensis]ELQ6019778.1 fimbrial protein [Cronobacter turicensis]ELQ6076746.1 fimbrial protein [Cronobacter turicensis]
MKKILLTTTLAALACSSPLTWAASTGEGQINFTGEILDAACEVVNSLSSPLAVDLGKVSKTAFTGVGSTTNITSFFLELKNCPETVTKASIKFGGNADTDNANVLALTGGTGAASGVGIQLVDADGTPLNLYTASADYALQTGTATNNLEFGARYIQTGAAVTAGTANGSSTFTVTYN